MTLSVSAPLSLCMGPIWRWLHGNRRKPAGLRVVKERSQEKGEETEKLETKGVPAPAVSSVAWGLNTCPPLQSSPSADVQPIPDFTFGTPTPTLPIWPVWVPNTTHSLKIRLLMAFKWSLTTWCHRGSHSVVLRPAASAAPGNHLEKQNTGLVNLLDGKF